MSTRYSSGVKSAPRSGYGLGSLLRDLQQRRMRTSVLSKTARETGKRGFFPEFGFGESFRGLCGMDLDPELLDPDWDEMGKEERYEENDE